MVCKQEPPGPKPFVTGLVKLRILYQGTVPETVTAANILHGQWGDNNNSTLAELDKLVTHFKLSWQGRFQALLATGWSYIGWQAQSMGGDGLVSEIVTTNPGTAGTLPLPPQSSVAVSWNCGITARGGRARTYLPGIPDNATTQQGSPRIQAGFADSVKTAANGFITDFNNITGTLTGVSLVVPSYYYQCRFRTPPLIKYVTSGTVHERLDSQRRRSGKESQYQRV